MARPHPYILRKSDIEEMPGTQKTHYLNPNAVRVNKSLGDAVGLTGIGFHIIEVEPSRDTTELHMHFSEDECIYVLQGSATAQIGNAEFEITEGDFVGYPAGGEAHNVINSGTKKLKLIVVGQRLDSDGADYPRLQKRLYRYKGRPWDLVNIGNVETPPPTAGKK